ncbi:hypothetical protein ACIRA0001_1907 [Acinetobacter radioresistens SK82]|uniref:Uncharacterized protein n=1 Tax=Acinetobacter radioresistens SK82 TaxID=596318 RepID=A0ABP2GHF7_ACIRA|nr:hypothetical protein ACIRA0001_1907 [Acinetobacter radioresistens SK82]EXB86598.1 hypothetical protein J538_1284 [Acinetobacter sp. 272263]EXE55956.1 hypothetical protein J579_2885 [Acinetobacter sp. 1239920]
MGSLFLVQNTFKNAHSIFIKIDLSVLMYILYASKLRLIYQSIRI